MEILRKKHAGQSGEDGNKELRTIEKKFRVSPSEDIQIQKNFQKSSKNKEAEFLRSLALSPTAKVADKNQIDAEYAILLMQIEKQTDISQTGKLGSNINQVARKLNGKVPSTFREILADLVAELEVMRGVNKRANEELDKLKGNI